MFSWLHQLNQLGCCIGASEKNISGGVQMLTDDQQLLALPIAGNLPTSECVG
jgi:hypothetical protein